MIYVLIKNNAMENFFRIILILITIQLQSNLVSAQADFESVGIIYKDSYVTVELQYKLNDPCLSGGAGKSSKFRYVITGSQSGTDKYLNWKMDYYNCDKSITCQTNFLNIGNFLSDGINENVDWTFDGSKLEIPFYDVTVSSSPKRSPSYIKAIPKSMPPKSIAGNININYGDKTTLSLKGGVLGIKSEWKWYADQCGSVLVGKGESIVLSPIQSTQYFVRAESPSDTSDCIPVFISVNPESKEADHIEGKQIVCVGEKDIPLSVRGGRLGKDAEWVWYKDSLQGQPLGKGSKILVNPSEATTYYVRAEGVANTTKAVSLHVQPISEEFQDPTSISGSEFVCKGSSASLDVVGGKVTTANQWHWYREKIEPRSEIGRGATLQITPDNTTTYIVRAEGVCGVSAEKIIKVVVGQLSQAPISISSADGSKNNRTQLSVTGGVLAENAKWVWYTDKCEDGKKKGVGESIEVNVRKSTVFFVRGEGNCNTTDCVSVLVSPSNNNKYTLLNFGFIPSFHSTASGSNSDIIQNMFANPVFSVTLGRLKKIGWYIRGKLTAEPTTTTYSINKDQQVTNFDNSNAYYVYTGDSKKSRWAVTGGLIKQLNRNLFLQLGGGYGERKLAWGIAEYSNQTNSYQKTSWGMYEATSFNGVELEGGLIIKASVFNLMLGANAIVPVTKKGSTLTTYKTYVDFHIGIGFIL